MKRIIFKVLPWLITVVALYIAFRGVDFSSVISHAKNADPTLLAVAFGCTMVSYLLRSRRWQHLFIHPVLKFYDSFRVLILGFFMNNVLPARTGEFVRAHAGSKVSGESRTLVLASIVSERLADGLTLSLFFVVFSLHAGDEKLSGELLLVAYLFGAITIGIFGMLLLKNWLMKIVGILHRRFHNKVTTYLASRFDVFIHGLAPLFSPGKLPAISLYSVAIWSIELAVFMCVASAYGSTLTIAGCVLFMVAVNFSSLIPAAPGGVGVVEMVATAAISSIGVDRAQALAMVLTQHIFQYAVVGIPGALVMLTWKGKIKELEQPVDIG